MDPHIAYVVDRASGDTGVRDCRCDARADHVQEIENPAPEVTPVEKRKRTCPVARFGRDHAWLTGAFYWPLSAEKGRRLYVGDDYVMCGLCGQVEENR